MLSFSKSDKIKLLALSLVFSAFAINGVATANDAASTERRRPIYNPSAANSPVSEGVNYIEPVVAKPIASEKPITNPEPDFIKPVRGKSVEATNNLPPSLPPVDAPKRAPSFNEDAAKKAPQDVISEPKVQVVDKNKDSFPKLSDVPERPSDFKSSADVRNEIKSLETKRAEVQRDAKHPWQVVEDEKKPAVPMFEAQSPKVVTIKEEPKKVVETDHNAEAELQRKMSAINEVPTSKKEVSQEPLKPLDLKPLANDIPTTPVKSSASVTSSEKRPDGMQKVVVDSPKVAEVKEPAPLNLKEPKMQSGLNLREPINPRAQVRVLKESRYAARRAAERKSY